MAPTKNPRRLKPAIRLSDHEKFLLVVYRCLDAEGQRVVDQALSAAWTSGKKINITQIQAGNKTFGVALRDLQVGHVRCGSNILAYFANVGRETKGGA